jgi:hypothetical protein
MTGITCLHCKRTLNSTARFCHGCGTTVEEVAIAVPKPKFGASAAKQNLSSCRAAGANYTRHKGGEMALLAQPGLNWRYVLAFTIMVFGVFGLVWASLQS